MYRQKCDKGDEGPAPEVDQEVYRLLQLQGTEAVEGGDDADENRRDKDPLDKGSTIHISKKNGLRCDLPRATMALYKTPRCKDRPTLFSISQRSVSYNASPNGPSSYAIGRGTPLSQRPSLPHLPCQRPLLPHPSCQYLHSHIPLANFPYLLATVPNSFAACISFPYAHRFDTFSLAVSTPSPLLKSAAYIFLFALPFLCEFYLNLST